MGKVLWDTLYNLDLKSSYVYPQNNLLIMGDAHKSSAKLRKSFAGHQGLKSIGIAESAIPEEWSLSTWKQEKQGILIHR